MVDGALFALVSSAGTDPEVLLILEARVSDGKMRWEYACGRFSDWELHVQRKDKEVYSSVPGETNPFAHDPLHLYRIYPEKVVTPEGKLLARIRQNYHDSFTSHLGLFCHSHSRNGGSAARNARQNSFLSRETPGHLDRLFVGHLFHAIDYR